MADLVHLEKDITVLCVTADSFPHGVEVAHQKLHQLVNKTAGRRYFGISHPAGHGKIIYHAAAEQMPGDNADILGCDEFFIRKGAYVSICIPNFMADIPGIGRAFEQLLQRDDIDPNGFCLEWYIGNDVQCMVPLAQQV